MTIIDLNEFRRKKERKENGIREPLKLKNNVISTMDEPDTMPGRLSRIKASLNRVDKMMAELRELDAKTR